MVDSFRHERNRHRHIGVRTPKRSSSSTRIFFFGLRSKYPFLYNQRCTRLTPVNFEDLRKLFKTLHREGEQYQTTLPPPRWKRYHGTREQNFKVTLFYYFFIKLIALFHWVEKNENQVFSVHWLNCMLLVLCTVVFLRFRKRIQFKCGPILRFRWNR